MVRTDSARPGVAGIFSAPGRDGEEAFYGRFDSMDEEALQNSKLNSQVDGNFATGANSNIGLNDGNDNNNGNGSNLLGNGGNAGMATVYGDDQQGNLVSYLDHAPMKDISSRTVAAQAMAQDQSNNGGRSTNTTTATRTTSSGGPTSISTMSDSATAAGPISSSYPFVGPTTSLLSSAPSLPPGFPPPLLPELAPEGMDKEKFLQQRLYLQQMQRLQQHQQLRNMQQNQTSANADGSGAAPSVELLSQAQPATQSGPAVSQMSGFNGALLSPQYLQQQNALLYYQMQQMAASEAADQGAAGQSLKRNIYLRQQQQQQQQGQRSTPQPQVHAEVHQQHHKERPPHLQQRALALANQGSAVAAQSRAQNGNHCTTQGVNDLSTQARGSIGPPAPHTPSHNHDRPGALHNDEDLLRLQDLSIMYPSEDAGSVASSSMTSSASTATITGRTPASSAASPSRHHSQTVYLPPHPPSRPPSTVSPSHHHQYPPTSVSQGASQLYTHHPHLSSSCSSLPLQDASHQLAQAQQSVSPQKPKTTSSSPKKPGRLENIYATLRKATTMRRTRTALMQEVPPPTVDPLATLHDASFPPDNHHPSTNRVHKDYERKVHPGHYHNRQSTDLDLSSLGSLPPTPPLTGTASSLSSTSSASSACSSAFSSFADGTQFQHLASQYQGDTGDGIVLPAKDFMPFVSGLMEDPFMDSAAFFGGVDQTGDLAAAGLHPTTPLNVTNLHIQQQQQQQRNMLALRPHEGRGPAPASAVSTACWPATTGPPDMPSVNKEDGSNTLTTATTAPINIPTTRTDETLVSPSAYLADATAAISGSSVIAAVNAAAQGHLQTAAAMAATKRETPSGNEMDTEEDWWQQSMVESLVCGLTAGEGGENAVLSTADHIHAASMDYGNANNASMHLALQPQQSGLPYFGYDQLQAANGPAMDAHGNVCYPMTDMATTGLMIQNLPPGAIPTPTGQVANGPNGEMQQPAQNQYYFPGVGHGPVPPPPPPPPQIEMEFRRDHRAGQRRPKPRAPSTGARYGGGGLHSPRKRMSAGSLSGSGNGASSSCEDLTAGAGGAVPSTPHNNRGQLAGRRSHSLQNLPRTSPAPGAAAGPATPSSSSGAIRKRRSASTMRRVSSTQGLMAAAAGGEPKTPSRRRSPSAEAAAEPPPAASGGGIGFVNFTPDDHNILMTGVAPSGSSKTKARRERELQEKTRKFSEQLVQLALAGGDVRKLEVEGLKLGL